MTIDNEPTNSIALHVPLADVMQSYSCSRDLSPAMLDTLAAAIRDATAVTLKAIKSRDYDKATGAARRAGEYLAKVETLANALATRKES